MKPNRLAVLEEAARDVGRVIQSLLPKGMRFVFVVSTEGEGGFMTYVSNIDRTTARELMRELEAKMATDSPGGSA